MARTDAENIAIRRAISNKPRIEAKKTNPVEPKKEVWKPIPFLPPLAYGQNTELKHTGDVEGLSIDVYRNYWRVTGSCQCYGDCDCANDRGKIREQADTYQATALRGKHKRNGKAYKLCPTVQAAINQHDMTLPYLT